MSRSAPVLDAFLAACERGDLDEVRALLEREPGLAAARHRGTTGLHLAAAHPPVLRALLEHGADPNARDEGDNALALHFAAGGGPLESVRILLDAGSDVQGEGDEHRLGVIGWATAFAEARGDVVDLLVQRGARHHVFSAVAMGDSELLRRVVERAPEELARRLSSHEQEQTALHYVVAPPDGLVGGLFRTGEHYRTLRDLVDLGAELEATDAKGRTPLAVGMLRGDREAMRILHEAGARDPEVRDEPASAHALGASMGKLRPMLAVEDVRSTIAWYEWIGFVRSASHEEGGRIGWAQLTFGEADLMLVPAGRPTREALNGVSLWIATDGLDELYARLKRRQMEWARAELAGEEPPGPEVRFVADLHTAFYGQREFGVRDPNGVEVMFAQALD